MKRWIVLAGAVALVAVALWWARRDRIAHGRHAPDDGEGEEPSAAIDLPAHFSGPDGGPLVDRKRRDEIVAVLRHRAAEPSRTTPPSSANTSAIAFVRTSCRSA